MERERSKGETATATRDVPWRGGERRAIYFSATKTTVI